MWVGNRGVEGDGLAHQRGIKGISILVFSHIELILQLIPPNYYCVPNPSGWNFSLSQVPGCYPSENCITGCGTKFERHKCTIFCTLSQT